MSLQNQALADEIAFWQMEFCGSKSAYDLEEFTNWPEEMQTTPFHQITADVESPSLGGAMALDPSLELSSYHWQTHSAVAAESQPQFGQHAHSSAGLYAFQSSLQAQTGTHGTNVARPAVQVQTSFGANTTGFTDPALLTIRNMGDIRNSVLSLTDPFGTEGSHHNVGSDSWNPLSSIDFMSTSHNEADFCTPLPSAFLTLDHQAGKHVYPQWYGTPFSATE